MQCIINIILSNPALTKTIDVVQLPFTYKRNRVVITFRSVAQSLHYPYCGPCKFHPIELGMQVDYGIPNRYSGTGSQIIEIIFF